MHYLKSISLDTILALSSALVLSTLIKSHIQTKVINRQITILVDIEKYNKIKNKNSYFVAHSVVLEFGIQAKRHFSKEKNL